MSAVKAAQYALSQMERGKKESVEDFAARMFYMQMEVYSAHAGRDLDVPFWTLPKTDRDAWIKTATEHKHA